VRQTGATIVGLVVLLELEFLAGREKLPGIPVRSLLPV
jgi:adenine/guanine phosphoribosyltransferase-like PRPP-binding protein